LSKIRKSAKGEDCQVRIPGVCNFNPETVVFAHLGGGGMGTKQSDLFGCYACYNCHEWLDGGYARTPNMTRDKVKLIHLEAIQRTQQILLDKGLITIK